MAWTPRTWWLVGTGTASAVLVVGAVAAWTWGQDAWWALSSSWPLDEAEQRAVSSCEDPGWTGLLRTLEQDVPDPCPSDWYAEAAKEHLKQRHLRRVRWLREVTRDEGRSERARFRAATALLLAGHETLPGLAVLTRGASLSPGRERLAEVVAAGTWPPEWADPDLRGDAALRALADDDAEGMALAVARLRHEALFEDGDPARRAQLVDQGLAVLGLGDGVLDDALARRDRGLAPHGLPIELYSAVVNGGQVCRERATVACLRFVADLLDERIDDEARPERLAASLPVPLWEVLYDAEPRTVAVRADAVGAVGAWVADAEEADRAERLVAVVAGGIGTGAARAGDPADVVRRHHGPPWTTALTAAALGEVSGVEVRVAADDDGVWVRVGDRDLRVRPCGIHSPIGEGEVPGEPWPVAAVMAQAALEAAAEAADDASRRRLATFAGRVDPLGAGPSRDALLGDGGEASPGRVAAELVAPGPATVLAGAAQERAVVGEWAARHAGERLRCPEGGL